MHLKTWFVCAALGLAPSASADETPSGERDVRMLRIEGAAVSVRRASEEVEETAKLISNSNALGHLPRLNSQLDELHRLVVSARMAMAVAHEELGPSGN
jgi:hypothetical protein